MRNFILLEFTNAESDSKILVNMMDISIIEELPDTEEISITMKNGTVIICKENYERVRKNIQSIQELLG